MNDMEAATNIKGCMALMLAGALIMVIIRMDGCSRGYYKGQQHACSLMKRAASCMCRSPACRITSTNNHQTHCGTASPLLASLPDVAHSEARNGSQQIEHTSCLLCWSSTEQHVFTRCQCHMLWAMKDTHAAS